MAESASATNVSTIWVITWPTLWLHWPVYLALARTERQFNNTVKFQLEPRSEEVVTDELIRNEFYARAEKGHAVLALCEPGPQRSLQIYPESENYGSLRRDHIMVRRLPVVWRQPHWLLWRGDTSSPPPGKRVWAYPIKTTSGDFVRTIFQSLPLLKSSRPNFHPLDQAMNEQRDRVESLLPESDVVATFTPWHEFLNVEYRQLAQKDRKAKRVRWWTLPGPSRDVTALLVPDVTADWTRKGGSSVIDAISRHLKNVLNELSDTHADHDLMTDFLSNNVSSVTSFLNESDEWLSVEFLRSVLCIYVRHGCYFPYRNVDSAISSEVQRRVRDRFDDLKEQALAGIQTDLNEFLGSTTEWHTLSFQERLQSWKTAMPRDEYDRDLWQRLTHFRQTDLAIGLENLIRGISVRTSQQPARLSLVSLGPRLPLECSVFDGNDHGERYLRCQNDRTMLSRVVPGEIRNSEQDCLACVVSGVPRSLLRPAAIRLANGLKTTVGYYCGSNKKDVFDLPCPVSVEDIWGFIDVFIEERRNPPQSQEKLACEIVLFNGFNGEESESGGPILVGIFWRGSTEGGKGTGSATFGLSSWAKQQKGLGHSVEWVWFWRANGKDQVIWSDPPSSYRDHRFIEGDVVIKPAREYFDAGDFTFAYVTAFRIEQGAHEG
ncbi:MAG: hypothetical protein NTX13_04395 [Acidobacteria bacterium]|nr:hypothetical protein [Acidobacteriota bacterium]